MGTIDTTTDISLKRAKIRAVWICLLSAAAVITVCSKSSPIYPFNDWVDANCFLTVGKSMAEGLVPYRDLYEQKGPLLYAVHALASLVSDTGFFGVYLIEIINAAIFLLFAYKTVEAHCGEKCVVLIPLLAAAVYSCKAFFHGDSAEELCLPLIAYCIMVGERAVREKSFPTAREFFFVGVTSGCVLWIKYSLLGCYIGWILVPAFFMLKSHKLAEMVKSFAALVSGVAAASVPIVIFFGLNNAIGDLLNVYFIDNLTLYTKSQNGPLFNIAAGVKLTATQAVIPTILIAGGLIWNAVKKEYAVLAHRVFAIAAAGILVFVGGQRYPYYPFILMVFAPIGLAPLWAILKNFRAEDFGKYALPIVLVLSTAAAFFICPNTYMLKYSKDELPQYKFKEIICSDENPTLLNYGFLDGGFYTVCDIVPSCKYFSTLNIPSEEMFAAQERCVQNGEVEFIVTRNNNAEYDLYEQVDSCSFELEGNDYTYYLYKLKTEAGDA